MSLPWFQQLKEALSAYYDDSDPNIVGHLRGSASPSLWRTMAQRSSGQMIILGTQVPTKKEWEAAGVWQRPAEQVITIDQLSDFIILYGGFMYRPWGHITLCSTDAQNIGFPGSLTRWKRNDPKRRA